MGRVGCAGNTIKDIVGGVNIKNRTREKVMSTREEQTSQLQEATRRGIQQDEHERQEEDKRDRKSTRLNSSHPLKSRMPSSA